MVVGHYRYFDLLNAIFMKTSTIFRTHVRDKKNQAATNKYYLPFKVIGPDLYTNVVCDRNIFIEHFTS